MTYLIAVYWPFVGLALAAGIVVGWWFQSPASVDRLTAWLEQGADEP